MKPSTILRRAACLLQERGWCQGHYYRSTVEEEHTDGTMEVLVGQTCALGAIFTAARGTLAWDPQVVARASIEIPLDLPMEVQNVVRDAIDVLMPDGIEAVPGWNDRIGQTAESVIRRITWAAGRLEAQGR